MKKWVFIAAFIFLFVLILLIAFSITNKKDELDTTMPDKLHPLVAQRSELLIQVAKQNGINVIITDGFRTIEEQNELYEKGRSTKGKIVTNVPGGRSYHNYGLAVDFAILNKRKQPIWDLEYDGNKNGKPDWFEVADMAKVLGFKWGGDWEGFKDYPHLQMDFGLSIYELQIGKRPPE